AQGGTGAGVGGAEALEGALAEALGALGGALGAVPRDEAGDVAAGGRDDADDATHRGADGERLGHLLVLRAVGPPAAHAGDRLDAVLAVGEDLVEQLGDAEEADDHRDERDPGAEVVDAEGETP